MVGCFSLSGEAFAITVQLLQTFSICAMLIWPLSFALPIFIEVSLETVVMGGVVAGGQHHAGIRMELSLIHIFFTYVLNLS